MPDRTAYVGFDDAVLIVDAECIGPIRDVALLKASLERPAATYLGEDLYPDLAHKAAALMHAMVVNHPLRDGDMVLAAVLTLVFLDLNNAQSTIDNDALFDLTVDIAIGTVREVPQIVSRLGVVARG
jgi:death-on-curing protein